ncbi:MAG: 50S ribosomal protein L37ae [Candidatus Acidifodinimicrobium sp.]
MRTQRYGATTRKNLDEIRALRTKKYKCPRCKGFSMRRVSAGIWECKRCGLKIASDAYSLSVSEISK